MLRVVLSIVMATALLAVAGPALESARVGHADATVEEELDRLDRAAQRLADENDPPPPGVTGAKHELVLVLPEASWSRASVESLSIRTATAGTEPGRDRSTTARWRVSGGTTRERHVPSIGVVSDDSSTDSDDTGKELHLGTGRQRVVLELRSDGSVLLRRPEVEVRYHDQDGP